MLVTEEAVQDVKRQALIELKRAVAAAEARACEAVSSDRVRLDRVLTESHPRSGSSNLHHHPTIVNSHLHPPPGVEAEVKHCKPYNHILCRLLTTR